MTDTSERNKAIKLGIIIISSVAVLIVIFMVVLHNISLKPVKIAEGSQDYRIGSYNLTKQGLSGFSKMIENTQGLKGKYNIASFSASLDSNAYVKSFSLNVDVYDGEKYIGTASYGYYHNKLTYKKPVDLSLDVKKSYNKNSEINYLDAQIKKIPIAKQIRQSTLENYIIDYHPDTVVKPNIPIYDCRNGKDLKVLSQDDYYQGEGGISDGKTSVAFRLSGGTPFTKYEHYYFVFDPCDPQNVTINLENSEE